MQSISVIHGLQGQGYTAQVRLCELTQAIAQEIQVLWGTHIYFEREEPWCACLIEENEAVPLALILNELILNAVKHGGKHSGKVWLSLKKGSSLSTVQIYIQNPGRLDLNYLGKGVPHSGLHLVDSLMPRYGALLVRTEEEGMVTTKLELREPVISLEEREFVA